MKWMTPDLILDLFSCNFAGGSCGLTEADDDDCKWKITNSAKGDLNSLC